MGWDGMVVSRLGLDRWFSFLSFHFFIMTHDAEREERRNRQGVETIGRSFRYDNDHNINEITTSYKTCRCT